MDWSIKVISPQKPFAAARLNCDPADMAHGTVNLFKPDKG
jgi:hypothetical protein